MNLKAICKTFSALLTIIYYGLFDNADGSTGGFTFKAPTAAACLQQHLLSM